MTSKVLDLTTVGHALNELCNAFLGDCEWEGLNDEQTAFLFWYVTHREEITKLSDLEALAATDHAQLNAFLVARGFGPMFEPFKGIGVASVLDMLVEWVIKGVPVSIDRYEGPTDLDPYSNLGVYQHGLVNYPAFKIGADGVDIYEAAGWEHPLLRLRTKTGHYLWLMKASEPASGLELNGWAQGLLARTEHRPSLRWTAGAIVPMLEMDLSADLSWMLGTTAIGDRGKYVVAQAFQKFKLRANDIGARVKVATGIVMAMASAGPLPPKPYELNDPFLGFFTQPGNETLALAAFWADTDVWQNPGGTLEEL